jgi:hypothetical protein
MPALGVLKGCSKNVLIPRRMRSRPVIIGVTIDPSAKAELAYRPQVV